MKTESPPKPIFLYLKSAEMNEPTLKSIAAAGYVPVAVDTFNDVRLIGPVERMDIVSRCAMRAIAESTYSEVKEKFALFTSSALAKQ